MNGDRMLLRASLLCDGDVGNVVSNTTYKLGILALACLIISLIGHLAWLTWLSATLYAFLNIGVLIRRYVTSDCAFQDEIVIRGRVYPWSTFSVALALIAIVDYCILPWIRSRERKRLYN